MEFFNQGLQALPLIPGEFFAIVGLADGMPKVTLWHVFGDQHEGVVLLADSQKQDNVVISQSPQQLNFSLEVLYLLAGLLT